MCIFTAISNNHSSSSGYNTREIGTLNYQIAGRTPMEWRDDNIDKVKLAQQEYNKNNAEKLKLAQQEYNKNNFEKLKLARQKNYTNNFEKIQEKTKLYRENNKDKKREQDKLYQKKQITCDCGCIITQGYLSKHLKTKKHIETLNPV
jgi:hypothetical protein